MKKLAGLLSILLLMSCDKADPSTLFVGKWQYSNNGITTSFEITGNSEGYKIKDILFNGSTWENSEFLGVEEEFIDRIVLRTKAFEPEVSKIEAIAFVNCRVSSDKKTMTVDSVYHVKVNVRTFYFNQSLTKK